MSDADGHNEQHMTDFEALMWNLEKDPRLSSNIANLSILDCAPNFADFRSTMDRASIVFPRLRQRVAPVLGRVAPPRWELDPNFDIDFHLRHMTLGGRGSLSELHALAADLAARPFDRTRPLWEFIVIDGLRNGKSAMVQRLHHTITDGQGGLQLSLEFIDFTRDAPRREPAQQVFSTPHGGSVVDALSDAVAHVTRRQLGMARRTIEGAVDAVVHPSHIVESGTHAVEMTQSTLRQVGVSDSPMSDLWIDRSLKRAFRTLDVSLASAKQASKRHGVTVNDFFVAGAAIAAGDYHTQMGSACTELRMAMPISHRTEKAMGGNVFSPSQSVIPIGLATPVDQLRAVHHILHATRAEPAVGAANALAGILNLLPTSVVTRTGYRIASSIDFVTSNLRAAPMDTFIAGALMESNYPMGPLAGAAFNLTTMSYRGTLNMGVVIDTGAVSNPDLLVTCLKSAFRVLAKTTAASPQRD